MVSRPGSAPHLARDCSRALLPALGSPSCAQAELRCLNFLTAYLTELPCSCCSLTLGFEVWCSQLGCHSGFQSRSLRLGVLIVTGIKPWFIGAAHETELQTFRDLIKHQANMVLDSNVPSCVIIKRLWKIVRAGWPNSTVLLDSAHTAAPSAASGQGAPRWLVGVCWQLLPFGEMPYVPARHCSLEKAAAREADGWLVRVTADTGKDWVKNLTTRLKSHSYETFYMGISEHLTG